MFTPVQSTQDIYEWVFDWPVDKSSIDSYYALGWRIFKVKNNPKKNLIFHSGYINGAKSFIGFIPSEEIGIIILTNQTSSFVLKNGISFWTEF